MDAASTGKFLLFEKELQRLGFEPDTDPKAPRCRYIVENLRVDVMPTAKSPIAIQHVDGPHFLATKIECLA